MSKQLKTFVRRNFTALEWGIGGFVVIAPLVAWTPMTDFSHLTLYTIFPPLGLIAFGLMWTHFILGALGRYVGIPHRENNFYMGVSMGLVLALIILHPLLLWTALFLDGYGLPPFSYMAAYGDQTWLLVVGTIALIIFLAYEFKRRYGHAWWWWIVDRLQVVAMLLIFIHGLGLGNEINVGWFKVVWVLYGVSLFAAMVYTQAWEKINKRDGV